MIFRLLWYFLVGYALYLLAKKLFGRQASPSRPRSGEVETFRDPVCGTYVTREDAVTEKFGEERLYFCSIDCLEKYRQDFAHTSTHVNESGGSR